MSELVAQAPQDLLEIDASIFERLARDPSIDILKLEKLLDMQERVIARQAEAAFNAAMARAQARITPVANNAANTQTNSRYAKLAAINDAIMPLITAEGLSVSFDGGESNRENYVRLVAIVSHAAGHSRRYHYDLPLDEAGAKGTINKTKVHATGSTTSYQRRYLVCMIFNVTTEDDDDGNGKSKGRYMTDEQITDFESAIESLHDKVEAEALWKSIAEACRKSGDRSVYDALKSSMTEKVRTFK